MALVLCYPMAGFAQGLGDDIHSLHSVLDRLYDEMIPLCSQLIGVGQGLAGFAALWYIAARVWRHLANAEPIDFYPLFRPFAIGFCILIFPSVLAMVNGVMQPTVSATGNMVKGSNKAIERLLKQKEDALKKTDIWQMYVGDDGQGDRDRWYKYTHDGASPNGENFFESVGNDMRFAMAKQAYKMRNGVKQFMSEVLKVLFEAAALCINTLRTFQLVVLGILGPLVFGLSVFDGFHHTLTVWLARYINIFLWLPVANIFGAIIGKIQENMLKIDIGQIQGTGDTFFSSADTGYIIFMIIGTIGYFTVPSVANYIVHAASGGALPHKVSGAISSGTRATTSMISGGLAYGAGLFSKGAGMVKDSYGDNHSQMNRSMADHGSTAPYSKGDGYMEDKLKGDA